MILRRARWIVLTAVAGLTLSVLVGWTWSWPTLTSWSGPVTMLPTTAVCLLMVIGIEGIQAWRNDNWRTALHAGLTTGILVAMSVSLLETISGRWIWPVDPFPVHRMAYSTAISLLVLVVASWWPRAHWVGLGILWTIVILVWWEPGLFGDQWMAWPTMAALIGLSVSQRWLDV